MEAIKAYESYPTWIIILSNLLSLLVYGLGFAIIIRVGLLFAILYLIYVAVLEIRLIQNHCTSCYYWGKSCGFGKGKISSWFFKKGDMSKFCNMKMTWKDMIPDFLISLIPFVIGVVLLVLKFDFILLSILLLLILLTTMGNGFIRGTLTCRYCKQRELGCPADKLFNNRDIKHEN